MSTTNNPNGKDVNSATKSLPKDMSAELSQLAALLAQNEAGGPDPDIDELLRRMDTADGIAQGLESRLDGMIGNLDTLLKALESAEGSTTGSGNEHIARENGNKPEAGR